MSPSTIGFDRNDPQPENEPQPVHITYADGKPDVWVTPPRNQILTAGEKTHARINGETDEIRQAISGLLRNYGGVMAPRKRDYAGKVNQPSQRRNWSSARPNHRLADAYIQGAFGEDQKDWETRPNADPEKALEALLERQVMAFDHDALEEARTAIDRWAFRPWKGCISACRSLIWIENGSESGHWASLDAQPVPEEVVRPQVTTSFPEVDAWLTQALADSHKTFESPTQTLADSEVAPVYRLKMTAAKMNEYYDDYLEDKQGQSANLQAALLLFAPLGNRWTDCEKAFIEPSSHLTEFAAEVYERIEKGQYHSHSGRIQTWISHVWKEWFLPDVQEKIYKEANLHRDVIEDDKPDGEDGSVDSGQLYREDVEQAMFESDKYCRETSVNVAALVEGFDPTTKRILYALGQGHSKEDIAEDEKVSSRTVSRKLEEVRKSSAHRDNVIPIIQACAAPAETFEPLLGIPEAAKLLCVHPKTLQALARAGRVPCVRMGKYWRFRASVLDEWVRQEIQSDHQSRRVSEKEAA